MSIVVSPPAVLFFAIFIDPLTSVQSLEILVKDQRSITNKTTCTSLLLSQELILIFPPLIPPSQVGIGVEDIATVPSSYSFHVHSLLFVLLRSRSVERARFAWETRRRLLPHSHHGQKSEQIWPAMVETPIP